jgi:hypothetical protein
MMTSHFALLDARSLFNIAHFPNGSELNYAAFVPVGIWPYAGNVPWRPKLLECLGDSYLGGA